MEVDRHLEVIRVPGAVEPILDRVNRGGESFVDYIGATMRKLVA